MASSPLLMVHGITKAYGGVTALAGVDFEVRPGQVTALLGENGAGKSTLMKILAGAERPDTGRIVVRGEEMRFASVQDARRHGVSIVFQELALFPDLDVGANVFSGSLPLSRLRLVDRAAMAERAGPVLRQVGLEVPLHAPLGALRLGERQLVEIARALLQDSDVLILDEPNSALNAAETDRLLEVVDGLRARGVAIVYISHRLEEVFRIADEIAVMRNGVIATRTPTERTSIPEVIRTMIGRDPAAVATKADAGSDRSAGGVVLAGVNLSARLSDVTLSAGQGEVVGLCGLEGAGVESVFDVLFGQATGHTGDVRLPGLDRAPRSITEAVKHGVARVQSDRRAAGVMLGQSILENLSHVSAGVLGTHGRWPRPRRLLDSAVARSDSIRIKRSSVFAPVHHLSGGNQQKVALGKWLEADPQVVLLDDPTRGVDVGSKAEIYAIVRQIAEQGRVVLFHSSELIEYGLVCDRVIVLHRGSVVGCLPAAQATEHNLLEAINTGRVPGTAGRPRTASSVSTQGASA